MKTKLQSALNYAQKGWSVFPVHSITKDGKCSCGKKDCTSQGKHPLGALVPRGLKDATTDLETINRWWKEYPDANIGIVTGTKSGFFVLDLDPRHGGDESLKKMEKTYGPLAIAPQVKTGGGGFHYLLKTPVGVLIGNCTNLGGYSGIDIKGEGGYIVAGGSNHHSGGTYEWIVPLDKIEDFIVDAPPFLLQLIEDQKKHLKGHCKVSNKSTYQGKLKNPEWMRRALKELKEGNRNNSFASLIGKFNRNKYSPDLITDLLKPHAEKCGFPLDELEKQVIDMCSRYAADPTDFPESEDFSWPEIIPMDAWGYPTDIDGSMMPKDLYELVCHLSEYTQTPKALVASVVLPVISTAIRNKFRVSLHNYTEPAPLWTNCVLEPGSRKSSIVKLLIRPIIEFESKLHSEWKEIHAEWKVQAREAEVFIKKNLCKVQQDPVEEIVQFENENDIMGDLGLGRIVVGLTPSELDKS
ncbi:MAG: bifunctional DNA primase/polymerase [Deltaproteobacteria bacterium]|nr:bifunctional DNA primase/polymerase [Deltaproteobacteria bacterium]